MYTVIVWVASLSYLNLTRISLRGTIRFLSCLDVIWNTSFDNFKYIFTDTHTHTYVCVCVIKIKWIFLTSLNSDRWQKVETNDTADHVRLFFLSPYGERLYVWTSSHCVHPLTMKTSLYWLLYYSRVRIFIYYFGKCTLYKCIRQYTGGVQKKTFTEPYCSNKNNEISINTNRIDIDCGYWFTAFIKFSKMSFLWTLMSI